MKTLTYETYLDKVYGCFLGKCVGGTAGGPAEGRKELLDFPLNEAILHTAAPNDDLDLQILWLEVIQQKGIHFTSRDLADSFYRNAPYGPGEYAYFKKNYARGILPPLSGSFNNRYYKNGMGCPIRSEIWACICPGQPERTKSYVFMDGSLDHESDSIWAEYFLASLEADAFLETPADAAELFCMIEQALARIPAESRIFKALRFTLDRYRAGFDWKYIRSDILKHFGHPDCTNLYQNLSFTLLALLFGGLDMRETIRLGASMGYDTDCICATAASVIGIFRGADQLIRKEGFTDTGIKAAVKLRRPNGPIRDFAVDVSYVGLTLCDVEPDNFAITDAPAYPPVPTVQPEQPRIGIGMDYRGDPVLRHDTPKTVSFRICSHFREAVSVRLSVSVPETMTGDWKTKEYLLSPEQELSVPFTVSLRDDAETLAQSNRISITAEAQGEVFSEEFGLNGADLWYFYGPFLRNNYDLSAFTPYEPYGPHFCLPAGTPWEDPVRDYHLNRFADIDDPTPADALFDRDLCSGLPADSADPTTVPDMVSITEDQFDLAALCPCEGPKTAYLLRYLSSPEDRLVDVTVGCTAPFRLWVNGTLIGENRDTVWWTLENRHFYKVPFRKGENQILLKLAQLSDSAKYSLIFRIPGGRWQQFSDFTSIVKK